MYIVDQLHTAINTKRQITFQYYEYAADKKKTLKHNGQVYVFSPYEMVWADDEYYVFGYSESHGKIVKFRVDRICKPELTVNPSMAKPEGFNAAEFSRIVFQMYDGETYDVELLCDNELMKVIVDKFGEGVNTEIADDRHFKARVKISASPTFFGWLFTFAGKMKILSPEAVKKQYTELAGKIEG